jgi:TolA-binding protein
VDCERLDSLAIDLIDPDGSSELDPRAQREAEEHLAGCARCTSAVERLRGGLRAGAELGLEDPSSLLEARILTAAGALKPEVSFSRRIARAITTAGSFAMRPQIAMAAVLVVMVGTSIVLLRGGGLPGAHRTKVTEEGTPVATLEPASPAVEGQGAPAVIGGEDKQDKAKPKESPKAEAAPTPEGLAKNLDKKSDDTIGGAEKAEKEESKAPAKDLVATADEDGYGDVPTSGAGGGTKGKSAPAQAAPPPPPAAPMPIGGVAGPADYEKSPTVTKKAAGAPAPTSAPPATTTPASYDDAMSAYKEARYAVAAKGFDAAAAAGQKPSSAYLYAARSYRATGSCALALPRFQKVVSSYPASPEAPHAALEGGQCAKALGDTATARALFEKAKTYPATQKQAENELAALAQPPAASPPAKAKPAKPSAVDNGY